MIRRVRVKTMPKERMMTHNMTSHERLDVAMRCKRPDRVPAKVPALPDDAPATRQQRQRFRAAYHVINACMGSWPMEGYIGFFYTVHPDVQYREYFRNSSHKGYKEKVQELIVPGGRLEGIELVIAYERP